MGRRSKKRKRLSSVRKLASPPATGALPPGVSTWSDEQGVRQAIPLPVPLLRAPDWNLQGRMTLAYQEHLRNLFGWDAIVQ